MGDPLSAIMCGFFMEHLEKEAITSALQYRPTLWKRYVDDMRTQELTAHLNSIDHTGNIKFTHEEEADRSIVLHGHKNPLQATIEGDIKIKIYRKPTHTDQYLLWTSEHLTAHKLSVVRTLHDRAALITDPKDTAQEEQHIRNALKTCQHPQWAIQEGTKQVKEKQETQTKKMKKTRNTKGSTEEQ